MNDFPKSLSDQTIRHNRIGKIYDEHVAPLNKFVDTLRDEMGNQFQIPYFDPLDGGINAKVLFLLEAAGPKAVYSGFISRSNPDETAKNFYLINEEMGIKRELTAIWNIVPWYIGDGNKIRPANRDDVSRGCRTLKNLLPHFKSLKAIVLVGGKSRSARGVIEELAKNVSIFETHHPSPMFINRSKENRQIVKSSLSELKYFLGL